MKNILSLVCVFALVAVTFGASATPAPNDTSPNVVCAYNVTPDLELAVTFVSAENVSYAFSPVCEIVIFSSVLSANCDLPTPESPNIGYIDNSIDPDLGTNTFADLFLTSELDSPFDCSTYPDPTLGESAECNPENGANDEANFMTSDFPDGGGDPNSDLTVNLYATYPHIRSCGC